MRVVEANDQLATVLAPLAAVGCPVHEHVTEEPAPPCAIIEPGDDFVQEDPEATFAGELLATFDVFLLVELDEEHDNANAADKLNELLPVLIEAVRDSEEWWLLGMSKPQAFYTSDWLHHGVRVSVRSRVTL